MTEDPFSASKDDYEDPYASGPVRAYRAIFKRSRRRRAIAFATMAVAGLALFGWKGAPWCIEHAKNAAVDCDDTNFKQEPGASLSCEGRARLWLWPAKAVPWTHRAARVRELRLRVDEQETRVTLAKEVFLDPAMRDQALDAMLPWVGDPAYPSDLRKQDWVFSIAASSGAREKMVALAPYAKGGFDRVRLVRAAIGLGDLDGAARFAREQDPDPGAYEWEMRRGALLCLVGDTTAGMAALHTALQRYDALIHYPYTEAQVASAVCGAPAGSQVNKLDGDKLWMAELITDPEPARALSHIAPHIAYDDQVEKHGEPFVAAALVGGAIAAPADVVAYAGMMRFDVGSSMTPWVAFGPTLDGYAIDPQLLERAADRLDELALQFEQGKVKVEPQKDKKGYDFFTDPWRYERDAIDKLYAEPGKHLRDAAYVFRLEAVAVYGALFDAASAKRIAARLPDVPGATALLVANALAHAGEIALARPLYVTATTGKDAATRVYAWLSLAMLELRDGHAREAVIAASKASESLAPVQADIEKADLGLVFDVRRSVGWVAAAAALAAGDATVPVPVGTPNYFESEPGDVQSVPKTWFELARAGDRMRRLARFRMSDPTILIADEAVLPAMIYVLREVARDGKVPDVWIDHVLPVHDASLNGASALRARAEAARWRGAADEAKRWDERAARLEKALTTPRSAALSHLAGLE